MPRKKAAGRTALPTSFRLNESQHRWLQELKKRTKVPTHWRLHDALELLRRRLEKDDPRSPEGGPL